jgi:1,4-dihydroxy-6-naphthoate synthase
MRTLSLGYSPCPNDTFLFYPLVHNRVDTGELLFQERLEDVETLNQLALESALDVCKVSWHAFAHLRDRYVMLRAGGAMGRGCGPLVVSRDPLEPTDLRGRKVAVPGRLTTALLLLRMFDLSITDIVCLPFREIMNAVAHGTVDAGVVIHESRFTYQSRGLRKVLDLGEWWEQRTGLPLPLGGIAARRSLGPKVLATVNDVLRAGVEFAHCNPEESVRYIRLHSQEMEDEVCAAHIDLYVNEFSLDPGSEGEKAAATLFALGEDCGLLPPSTGDVYLSRS